MKIRIYTAEKDSEKTISFPTGLLLSKVGMYFMAKALSSQSRKEYEKKIDEAWKNQNDMDMDELLSPEEVQQAERLDPPITQEQALELFTALKNSKYLLHGLPLISIDDPDGTRVRIDL